MKSCTIKKIFINMMKMKNIKDTEKLDILRTILDANSKALVIYTGFNSSDEKLIESLSTLNKERIDAIMNETERVMNEIKTISELYLTVAEDTQKSIEFTEVKPNVPVQGPVLPEKEEEKVEPAKVEDENKSGKDKTTTEEKKEEKLSSIEKEKTSNTKKIVHPSTKETLEKDIIKRLNSEAEAITAVRATIQKYIKDKKVTKVGSIDGTFRQTLKRDLFRLSPLNSTFGEEKEKTKKQPYSHYKNSKEIGNKIQELLIAEVANYVATLSKDGKQVEKNKEVRTAVLDKISEKDKEVKKEETKDSTKEKTESKEKEIATPPAENTTPKVENQKEVAKEEETVVKTNNIADIAEALINATTKDELKAASQAMIFNKLKEINPTDSKAKKVTGKQISSDILGILQTSSNTPAAKIVNGMDLPSLKSLIGDSKNRANRQYVDFQRDQKAV